MRLYKDKIECCGCGSCADICPKQAITFKKDNSGFYYPKVDEKKCVSCGLCEKACAFKSHSFENGGYIQKAVAVKHKDENTRRDSSSGGIYSALTDDVLKNGGVVYGAAFATKNTVSHMRCETAADRNRTRGSKYVQSDMIGVYNLIEKDLEKGRKVLFSGTPCQVAAVGKRFEKQRENLYLVDLICHGVPSPDIFKKHISLCEKLKGKSVKEYLFRSSNGGARNTAQTIIYDDGEVDCTSKYIKIYFNLFNENKILRESCFECPYARSERAGDITIGDFWGVENALPDFTDKNGVSAVLINTSKGEELINRITSDIDISDSSFEDIAKKNPNLKRPSPRPRHNKFKLLYKFLGYGGAVKGYYKKSRL